MFAGAAGVIGDAQRQQADGTADMAANPLPQAFAVDGLAEKIQPQCHQRIISAVIKAHLCRFVARGQNADDEFEPVETLY